jgi:N utilization substance protein B
MLSRRHIRIKVLQALYGHYQSDNPDTVISLRNLKRSLDRIFELYLYDISTLREILRAAEDKVELGSKKLRPSQEDLDPNLNFVNNKVLRLIAENVQLSNAISDKSVSWSEYREHFKKIYNQLKDDDFYNRFMSNTEHSFKEDKKLVKYVYATYICNNEFLHQFYEDLYIHWADDLDAAQMMTTKTMKTMDEHSNASHPLVKLFKDSGDEDFGQMLFRKVTANNAKYEKWISDKTSNWDTDRIAVVDILLMKMALAEFTEFQEIPTKVTLNEYIELSKQYSTPRSGIFINGVLDKLVLDLKESKDIIKVGRGLL